MRKNKVHVRMLFSIGIAFGTAFITKFITNPYSIGLKVKMGIPIAFYFPNAEILAKLTRESAFALDQFFLNAAAWTAIYFFLAFFLRSDLFHKYDNSGTKYEVVVLCGENITKTQS